MYAHIRTRVHYNTLQGELWRQFLGIMAWRGAGLRRRIQVPKTSKAHRHQIPGERMGLPDSACVGTALRKASLNSQAR